MAELGALSLRIETIGDKQALSSLDAIDRKAQQLGGSEVKLTAVQKALNREIAEATKLFALQARTADASNQQQVASMRQLATAQLQYLQRIGASETQLLQFASAAQTFEQKVARANATASSSVQVFGRDVVAASGKVSAFGKSGLNAFNALAFGMSQMAATGTVSFRSLATSMTSVLAFFGPQGAIAAGLTATGLVMVDFFTRSRREIEETAKKAKEEAEALQRDLGQIANQGDLQGFANRERAIRQGTPEGRGGVPFADALEDMQAEALRLGELLQQIGDLSARKAVGDKAAAASLKTLLDSIGNDVKAKQQERDALLAEIRTKEVELAEIIRRRQTSAATQLGAVRIETEKPRTLEDTRKAIEAEIEQLLKLSQARQLTGAEIVRLAALEGQLAAEMASTHPTKAREVELWEQITKARKAAGLALPAATVQPITPSTPQAAAPGTLALPNIPVPTPEEMSAARQRMQENFDAAFGADLETQLASSLAAVITNGIAAGFAEGLSTGNFAEGFKAMAGAFASGLGALLVQIGQQVIASSTLIAKAVAAIATMNPVAALAAGIALVALGSALRGKGGRGGAGAGGGGGYGGGSGGGLDTIRSFVTGSDQFRALTEAPKGLRDTIGDLRRSTFGASTIGALSPRSALGSLTAASAPANPFSGMQFLVVNTPGGQSFVARQVNDYNRDRRG